jgi:hypothetical protein
MRGHGRVVAELPDDDLSTGLPGALQSRLHRFDSGRRRPLLPTSSDPIINFFPIR